MGLYDTNDWSRDRSKETYTVYDMNGNESEAPTSELWHNQVEIRISSLEMRIKALEEKVENERT